MGDGLRGRAQDLDARGHHGNRGERAGSDDDHAALELIFLDADEVQGHAAPWSRRIERALVGLDPADTRALTARQYLDLVAGRERPIDEGPRDDRAETGQGEGPVYPKARPADITTRLCGPQHRVERGNELIKAGLRGGRDLDHRRAGERRSLERRPDVGPAE